MRYLGLSPHISKMMASHLLEGGFFVLYCSVWAWLTSLFLYLCKQVEFTGKSKPLWAAAGNTEAAAGPMAAGLGRELDSCSRSAWGGLWDPRLVTVLGPQSERGLWEDVSCKVAVEEGACRFRLRLFSQEYKQKGKDSEIDSPAQLSRAKAKGTQAS